jgi:hypothetical protein
MCLRDTEWCKFLVRQSIKLMLILTFFFSSYSYGAVANSPVMWYRLTNGATNLLAKNNKQEYFQGAVNNLKTYSCQPHFLAQTIYG